MKSFYEKYKNIKHIRKILILIFAFIFYHLTFNHVDVINFCFIDIDSEYFRGERNTVKRALNELKSSDLDTYKSVCTYVETINEKWCVPGDARVDSTYRKLEIEGCFVRGSHTIYINPTQDTSHETIIQRRDQIARYGMYAKDFWEPYQR